MAKLIESEQIQGVITAEFQVLEDERGRFSETFRSEWFPQRDWQQVQCNRSESRAGSLRGLHYHHLQVDYWQCVRGHMRVGLFDLRKSSPTRGVGIALDMEGDRPLGLYIPSGVAHGFLALTDVTLLYVVDRYYEGGGDEFGVAWDDPEIGLDWGARVEDLIISKRDRENSRVRDLSDADLPT